MLFNGVSRKQCGKAFILANHLELIHSLVINAPPHAHQEELSVHTLNYITILPRRWNDCAAKISQVLGSLLKSFTEKFIWGFKLQNVHLDGHNHSHYKQVWSKFSVKLSQTSHVFTQGFLTSIKIFSSQTKTADGEHDLDKEVETGDSSQGRWSWALHYVYDIFCIQFVY